MSDSAAKLVDTVLPNVPIRQYVLSLPFELRMLAAFKAPVLSALVRIFFEALSWHYKTWASKIGIQPCNMGAITFVQRFGSSLNLNVHLHVGVTDGVFQKTDNGVTFHEAEAPSESDLQAIVERTYRRTVVWLKKRAYLSTLALEERSNAAPAQTSLEACAQLAMRLAGMETLRKDGTDQVEQTDKEESAPRTTSAAVAHHFNLHASVRIEADDDIGRERLCRYMARPAISLGRLSKLADGRIAYRVKKLRGGREKVRTMTPLEFLARLAAIVPPPRYPLLRYSGVFAPNSSYRKHVVPKPPIRVATCRTSEAELQTETPLPETPPTKDPPHSNVIPEPPELIAHNILRIQHWNRILDGELYASGPRLKWALLLRRTFRVDVMECVECKGRLRIVGMVDEPETIRAVLQGLGVASEIPVTVRARDPTSLFDQTYDS